MFCIGQSDEYIANFELPLLESQRTNLNTSAKYWLQYRTHVNMKIVLWSRYNKQQCEHIAKIATMLIWTPPWWMAPHLTMSAKACAESAYVDLSFVSHGHSEGPPEKNVHCFVQHRQCKRMVACVGDHCWWFLVRRPGAWALVQPCGSMESGPQIHPHLIVRFSFSKGCVFCQKCTCICVLLCLR